jgi:hypothetical protein
MKSGPQPTAHSRQLETEPKCARRFSLAVSRQLMAVCTVALAAVTSGCSNFEPWVKPYERAALADPIMAASRNPIADDFMLHVYEVREGARGAAGSAGGGCGCN